MQQDSSYKNLQQVLQFLLKILLDADEFTFFIHLDKKWEIYQFSNNSIKVITFDEAQRIIDELTYIHQLCIHRIDLKQKTVQIEETCKLHIRSFKYKGSMKLCQEKLAFYKYFLRTTDSLLFDFNIQVEQILSRMSRSISQSLNYQFLIILNRNINFDPKAILFNKNSQSDIILILILFLILFTISFRIMKRIYILYLKIEKINILVI
ncbi:unnamed protein product [Paramecium sonneborni]|uniref:Transmembrane protein n=1 Tax=Paramecium sonneborni TaxID=65129 RepID=A0A8S1PXR7_9CILI|nr:unnamed protein product [Paramecium sonneborni]